jgi:hypothetical protein
MSLALFGLVLVVCSFVIGYACGQIGYGLGHKLTASGSLPNTTGR